MAIDFCCLCGQRLRAKDSMGGRQLRCPRCNAIFAIPRAATPGMAADFICFACTCGKKLKAYPTDAGELVNCPRCEAEMTVPAQTPPISQPTFDFGLLSGRALSWTVASQEAPTIPSPGAPPSLVMAKAQTRYQDNVISQRRAVWGNDGARNGMAADQRRIKPFPWLPVFALGGLVLLASAWLLGSSSRAGEKTVKAEIQEVDLMPPETVQIVTIRIGSLWDRSQEKEDEAAIQIGRGFVDSSGWKAGYDGIESVTRIWMPADPRTRQIKPNNPSGQAKEAKNAHEQLAGDGQGKVNLQPIAQGPARNAVSESDVCWIVRTKRINRHVSVAELMGLTEKSTWHKHTYYEKSLVGTMPIYVVGDTMFVASTDAGIKHFIYSKPRHGQARPFAEALEAGSKHDVVVAFDFTKYQFDLPKSDPKRVNPVAKAVAELGFATALLAIDVERQAGTPQLKATLQMVFDEPGKATEAKQIKDQELASGQIKLTAAGYESAIKGNKVVFQYKAAGADVAALDALLLSYASLADQGNIRLRAKKRN